MIGLERILIIQTAFIGDVVLATAVAESLHAAFPSAQITLLVRAGNESVLDGHPYLEVWTWEKRRAKLRNLLGLISRIRRRRFDLVINLHRFASSGVLTALSGAAETRGFEKNPLSVFFTKRFPHTIGKKGDSNYLHETERNHALIADLATISPPRIYPDKNARKQLGSVPNRTDAEYSVIAPASVWFTKQWPPAKWIEVTDRLSPQQVFLIGAPGDRALAEQIRNGSRNPSVENLCGQLSLQASALLMRDARMNYVNDSAPLHLCSAVDAPVTAVFCSTVPEFGFGPLGKEAQIVESPATLPCRPCGLHGHRACPEGHFRCAMEIDADKVIAPQRKREP